MNSFNECYLEYLIHIFDTLSLHLIRYNYFINIRYFRNTNKYYAY